MCSICAAVASAFMTTITVNRPPKVGWLVARARSRRAEPAPPRTGRAREGPLVELSRGLRPPIWHVNEPAATEPGKLQQNKKAPGPCDRSRGLKCKLREFESGVMGILRLGPATGHGPGKHRGPPPGTVKGEAVVTRVGPTQRNALPNHESPNSVKSISRNEESTRSGAQWARTWSIPTVRLWSSMRLPDGQPVGCR